MFGLILILLFVIPVVLWIANFFKWQDRAMPESVRVGTVFIAIGIFLSFLSMFVLTSISEAQSSVGYIAIGLISFIVATPFLVFGLIKKTDDPRTWIPKAMKESVTRKQLWIAAALMLWIAFLAFVVGAVVKTTRGDGNTQTYTDILKYIMIFGIVGSIATMVESIFK